MRFILFVLITMLLFCSKKGIVNIAPQVAVGDMPIEAKSTQGYELALMNVTDDTDHNPRSFVGEGDTLKLSWGYKSPDNLPVDPLPFILSFVDTVINSDDIWNSNQVAKVKWKNWVNLQPGPWQLFVRSYNPYGNTSSGRYDIMVVGDKSVKVYIQVN